MNTSKKFFLIVLLSSLIAACGSEDKNEEYADRMAEEHKNDTPVENGTAAFEQEQPVETKTVNYAETDSGAVEGYLATPQNAEGDLPGIIVIHEWWGLNDNIRMMTKRLAGLGYKALAVDLYNGKVAENPEKAKELMFDAQYQTKATLNNLEQAYNYLSQEQGAGNIGVIGWCFGGGWSLQTALNMPTKIDAVVIYYGRLITNEEELRLLEMPVIGFFGKQDEGIPVEKVREFKGILNSLDKNAEIHIYEEADHAFANPSGTKYNEEAAQDAWQKTKAFLDKNLKNSSK